MDREEQRRTDARALLRSACELDSDPTLRGSSAAFLSVLEAEDGHPREARRYLRLATRYGTRGIEMRLARAAVAALDPLAP